MTFTELKDAVRDYLESRLATARAEWDFNSLSGGYVLSVNDCGRSLDREFPRFVFSQMTEADLTRELNRMLCEIVVFPMANGAADNLRRRLRQALDELDRYREQAKEQRVIEASYDAL